MEHTALGKVEARRPLNLPENPPQEKDPIGPGSKQPVIEKYIQQLGRFGQPHVQEYLYDLKRRNCRPNTLRSNFTTWMIFCSYLKRRGRTSLETVTRDDLSSFIEHEQDRGMQPNTVHTRIRLLYALLKFLVDREVVPADLLTRKLRLKVPEALPRALEPEDVQQLLAVITHERDRALILVLLRTGMRIGELLDQDERGEPQGAVHYHQGSSEKPGGAGGLSEGGRLPGSPGLAKEARPGAGISLLWPGAPALKLHRRAGEVG
jgi:hypothetical protein